MLHRWMTPTEPYKALGTTDPYSRVWLGYWSTRDGPEPTDAISTPYARDRWVTKWLDIGAIIMERLPNAPHVNAVARELIEG